MNIEIARTIARAAFRSSRELGALIPILKNSLNDEEFRIHSKAIATAIASIQLEIVNKLIADHPNLEAEIESAIKRDGHYS